MVGTQTSCQIEHPLDHKKEVQVVRLDLDFSSPAVSICRAYSSISEHEQSDPGLEHPHLVHIFKLAKRRSHLKVAKLNDPTALKLVKSTLLSGLQLAFEYRCFRIQAVRLKLY